MKSIRIAPNPNVTSVETSQKLEIFKKKIGELQETLTNYLNVNPRIPYLEETREIAFSIQELSYKHKSLVQQFSDTIDAGRNFSILSQRLNRLESESYVVESVLQSLVKS